MMKKFMVLFLLITQLAFANDSIEFEVEALAREGKTTLAIEKVLSSKLLEHQESKLMGLIKLKAKDYKSAADFFKIYLAEEPHDIRIRNFYVQALMQNKNFSLAEVELKKVKEKQRDLKWTLLNSMILWDGNKKEEALSFLKESKKKFNSPLLPRQIYFFLSELFLFESVISNSRKDIDSGMYGFDLGLYVVSLLKKAKSYKRADLFFEYLTARYKDQAELLRERGLYEIERSRNISGAEFLSKAANLDHKYAYEAAEVFLKTSSYSRALYYNRKVLDPRKKGVQLFTIHLQSEEYVKAGGLYYNLIKTGGLENQKVAYALAYVGFKIKDYSLFDKAFEKVTDPSLYSKALVLKKKVEECKGSMELECEFI